MRSDPEPLEPFHRAGAGLAALHAMGAKAEGDVLDRGEVREEQVVLEHHADGPQLGWDMNAAGDVIEHCAVELDSPRVDGDEAGDRAEERRLARAVRA